MAGNTVGFLGGGRIVRILLEGWQRAGCMPVEVVVHDSNLEIANRLHARFPAIRVTPDPWLVGHMNRIFVAVHPPAVLDVLRPLAGKLSADAVVVSLAPKVKLAQLSEALGQFVRIARSIPNAASLLGVGFNPIAFAPGLDEETRNAVLGLFAPLGQCPVVPEEHLEAYAVLTAMGPTYLWFQMQQLRELGQSFGLSSAEVDAGLDAMIRGAAQTFFQSGLSPEEVMDLVPVKPLHDDEAAIRTAYHNRLTGIYQKLTGR
jgi:pyrroline-5-carboxylate reductase